MKYTKLILFFFLYLQHCYYIKRWGCNPAASHQIDESGQKGNAETHFRLGWEIEWLEYGPRKLYPTPIGRGTPGLPKVYRARRPRTRSPVDNGYHSQ